MSSLKIDVQTLVRRMLGIQNDATYFAWWL